MKDKLIGLLIGLVLGSVITVLADLPPDRNAREMAKFRQAVDGSVAINVFLTE